MKKIILAVAVLLLFAACTKNKVVANKPELVFGASNAAVKGYDVVAYFKAKKPVQGLAIHSYEYAGKAWFFSSQENQDDFIDEPEKFMPQYGGNCAYCLAVEVRKIPSDPNFWYVSEGKLYLNAHKEDQELWLKDYQKFIQDADANWKKIKNIHDKK